MTFEQLEKAHIESILALNEAIGILRVEGELHVYHYESLSVNSFPDMNAALIFLVKLLYLEMETMQALDNTSSAVELFLNPKFGPLHYRNIKGLTQSLEYEKEWIAEVKQCERQFWETEGGGEIECNLDQYLKGEYLANSLNIPPF